MAIRAAVRFKAEDIFDAPDSEDGKRWEVIDGEFYMAPPPSSAHQYASGALHAILWQHVTSNRLGVVLAAPLGVVLDEENGIQPDVVFVSAARREIVRERGIEGAPDLVVEVLSPSTRARDLGVKMRRYAAAGVSHCWILDPTIRSVTAYRLSASGYDLTGTFGPGSTFQPELFPGLSIRTDGLWA